MDNGIETLPNSSNVGKILYTPDYSVICGVSGIPFAGILEIYFEPDLKLLEFESFEGWLKTISTNSYTVESLCRFIHDTLKTLLGDITMRVTVHAKTTVHAQVSATIESK